MYKRQLRNETKEVIKHKATHTLTNKNKFVQHDSSRIMRFIEQDVYLDTS